MTPPSMVVLGLVAYNLVQNLVLGDRGYVPANLVVTAAAVGVARRCGCDMVDLGLDRSHVISGLRWGTAGAAAAVSAVSAGAALRSTRGYFLDERASGHSTGEALYRATVRFPLGTALFEEVAFRGVVPAMWRRGGSGPIASTGVGAVAFGLWHLLPTWRVLGLNPLGRRVGGPSRWKAVAFGAAVTSVAGLGFSWLAERSGSLLAPWMAHAAFNTTGYLVGREMWRAAGGSSGG